MQRISRQRAKLNITADVCLRPTKMCVCCGPPFSLCSPTRKVPDLQPDQIFLILAKGLCVTQLPSGEETIQPGPPDLSGVKPWDALPITDTEEAPNVGTVFYSFDCAVDATTWPTHSRRNASPVNEGLFVFRHGPELLSRLSPIPWVGANPLSGTSDRQLVEKKYGLATYLEVRNEYHKNGRDSFLIELAKWGSWASRPESQLLHTRQRRFRRTNQF
jgi:hypothetical protein